MQDQLTLWNSVLGPVQAKETAWENVFLNDPTRSFLDTSRGLKVVSSNAVTVPQGSYLRDDEGTSRLWNVNGDIPLQQRPIDGQYGEQYTVLNNYNLPDSRTTEVTDDGIPIGGFTDQGIRVLDSNGNAYAFSSFEKRFTGYTPTQVSATPGSKGGPKQQAVYDTAGNQTIPPASSGLPKGFYQGRVGGVKTEQQRRVIGFNTYNDDNNDADADQKVVIATNTGTLTTVPIPGGTMVSTPVPISVPTTFSIPPPFVPTAPIPIPPPAPPVKAGGIPIIVSPNSKYSIFGPPVPKPTIDTSSGDVKDYEPMDVDQTSATAAIATNVVTPGVVPVGAPIPSAPPAPPVGQPAGIPVPPPVPTPPIPSAPQPSGGIPIPPAPPVPPPIGVPVPTPIAEKSLQERIIQRQQEIYQKQLQNSDALQKIEAMLQEEKKRKEEERLKGTLFGRMNAAVDNVLAFKARSGQQESETDEDDWSPVERKTASAYSRKGAVVQPKGSPMDISPKTAAVTVQTGGSAPPPPPPSAEKIIIIDQLDRIREGQAALYEKLNQPDKTVVELKEKAEANGVVLDQLVKKVAMMEEERKNKLLVDPAVFEEVKKQAEVAAKNQVQLERAVEVASLADLATNLRMLAAENPAYQGIADRVMMIDEKSQQDAIDSGKALVLEQQRTYALRQLMVVDDKYAFLSTVPDTVFPPEVKNQLLQFFESVRRQDANMVDIKAQLASLEERLANTSSPDYITQSAEYTMLKRQLESTKMSVGEMQQNFKMFLDTAGPTMSGLQASLKQANERNGILEEKLKESGNVMTIGDTVMTREQIISGIRILQEQNAAKESWKETMEQIVAEKDKQLQETQSRYKRQIDTLKIQGEAEALARKKAEQKNLEYEQKFAETSSALKITQEEVNESKSTISQLRNKEMSMADRIKQFEMNQRNMELEKEKMQRELDKSRRANQTLRRQSVENQKRAQSFVEENNKIRQELVAIKTQAELNQVVLEQAEKKTVDDAINTVIQAVDDTSSKMSMVVQMETKEDTIPGNTIPNRTAPTNWNLTLPALTDLTVREAFTQRGREFEQSAGNVLESTRMTGGTESEVPRIGQVKRPSMDMEFTREQKFIFGEEREDRRAITPPSPLSPKRLTEIQKRTAEMEKQIRNTATDEKAMDMVQSVQGLESKTAFEGVNEAARKRGFRYVSLISRDKTAPFMYRDEMIAIRNKLAEESKNFENVEEFKKVMQEYGIPSKDREELYKMVKSAAQSNQLDMVRTGILNYLSRRFGPKRATEDELIQSGAAPPYNVYMYGDAPVEMDVVEPATPRKKKSVSAGLREAFNFRVAPKETLRNLFSKAVQKLKPEAPILPEEPQRVANRNL